MARSDIHRPAAIVPADYEFVGIESDTGSDFGTCMILAEERRRISAHMQRTGATYSKHAHGGVCMVCGNANAIFTALFFHEPTNSYVRMGRDCADKCDMGNEAAFRRVTDAVTAARVAKAGKLRAEGLLSERGLSAAWDVFTGTAEGKEETIIRDIVGKIVRYGNASDAQYAFVAKLLAAIPARQAVEAQRAAEREQAAPVRVGRFEIEAEVVSVKFTEDNGYGSRRVMTIRTAEGWMAWGTAPASVERGDRIAIKASFEPSDRDPKFGFFKRPSVKQAA